MKESWEECRRFCPVSVLGLSPFRLAIDIDIVRLHTATLQLLCRLNLHPSARIILKNSELCKVKRIEIVMNGLGEIYNLFNPLGRDGAREFIELFTKVQHVRLVWRQPCIYSLPRNRGWGRGDMSSKAKEVLVGHFQTMVERRLCKRVPEITIAPRYDHRKSKERIWPSIRLMFERAESW